MYKPRRARESPLYRLVEHHLEELLRVWPTRFARQHGLLTIDGGKTADGSWKSLPEWDGLLLMRLFRERRPARLVEAHAISPELVCRLVSRKHPGFSAHVGEPIEPARPCRLRVSCEPRQSPRSKASFRICPAFRPPTGVHVETVAAESTRPALVHRAH